MWLWLLSPNLHYIISNTAFQILSPCKFLRSSHLPAPHFLKYNLLLLSCSVMSDSLRPRWLQHSRLPCPSLSPRACSNLCPLNQWCHPTISASVVPFSSGSQSFSASGSFPMSQFFTSGDQSITVSASASVLPMNWLFALVGQSIGALAPVLTMNIQGWLCLGLTGLIFLLSKVLSKVFSSTTV